MVGVLYSDDGPVDNQRRDAEEAAPPEERRTEEERRGTRGGAMGDSGEEAPGGAPGDQLVADTTKRAIMRGQRPESTCWERGR